MLAELIVHNLVIVEQALLQPGEGLVVISGETGAGKSLLLDAIDLVSGARVRPGLVGPWGDAATVCAVFQVAADRAARIADIGQIPVADGQVILRRRVTEGGRSQAWINDVPVTVGSLRAVADHLIDLHAQHEPIRLADPLVQMDLLDTFAGLLSTTQAYRAAHQAVQDATRLLADLDGGERQSIKEADFLAYQLRAFDELAPRRGELAELEQRHALLSGAGAWRDQAAHAVEVLSDSDQAVLTVLGRLQRKLQDAPEPRLRAAADSLAAALEQVRDAAAHVADAAESIATDPAALQVIEERLDRWNDLLRRHGPDEAALFAAWEEIARRQAELSGIGERREAAAEALRLGIAERTRLGQQLRQARSKAFVRLAQQVHEHLGELGMPKARIHLIEREGGEPTACGLVHQEIAVCTNPGQKPGSIRDVASGGEASRLMLAISAALSSVDHLPLMVFDEVDSGVGGRLGQVIGGKLAHLSVGRTVLAVTHTPHVAACGHRQYVVSKHQGDDRTVVQVEALTGARREAEIAEMLGGGAGAAAQARELLGQSAASVPRVQRKGAKK
jgi:DNA repair protein RecN (Recombination protein N)